MLAGFVQRFGVITILPRLRNHTLISTGFAGGLVDGGPTLLHQCRAMERVCRRRNHVYSQHQRARKTAQKVLFHRFTPPQLI